ncbi:MAG TPA: hypothetical protein VF270_03555, partial [Ignavibacteriaceae bacterium]
MLRKTYTTVLAVTLLITSFTFSQVTYTGPVTGNVPSGAMVNTNSFSDSPTFDNEQIINDKNLIYPDLGPSILENDGSTVFQPTYVNDPNVGDNLNAIGDNSFLLAKWDVSQGNNVIPPDPT